MKIIFVLASIPALLAAHSAGAQAPYPAKPVRVILPFPPGGGADALMRPLAPGLAQLTGQQWVIDNRPGANGNIAAELTANAPPDGYTLFFANSSFAINPSLYSKLAFDVTRDFAPITLAGIMASVLAAHPSLPVKTVHDLITLARKQPGKLNFASGGAGNTMHLGVELLKSMAKVEMTHVPYKGGGPAIVDVLAGQCDLMVVNIGPVIAHIRAGKLNPLGVTTKTRSPLLPTVPTIEESGLPGYESTTWYGLLGPAALPKDVIARVNGAVASALKAPDMRERYLALAAEVVTNTPEQFAAFLRKDMQDWAKVVKASGAKLD